MRTIRVAASRVPGWLDRFADRHGPLDPTVDADRLRVTAADDSTATLIPTIPLDLTVDAGADVISAWADAAARPPRCAVVAVRRGGFLAAVIDSGTMVSGKAGRRHVQGRTAAGGWSQQRFARRRAQQSDALVDAAADYTAAQILPHLPVAYLVTGGDRALVRATLTDPRLRPLQDLPRAAHLALPDPNSAALRALPAAISEVTIEVYDVERDELTDGSAS